jgi:hypothetical protein
VHPACDVSAAYQLRVAQLDVEVASPDAGKETIEALQAPLDVCLPLRPDLDRGPMLRGPGALGANAKCVGK